MDEPDVSERTRQLKREIESELGARSDVTGFEFRSTEDPGVNVEVEESDDVRLYHVTLERLPDDTVKPNWSYLGQTEED